MSNPVALPAEGASACIAALAHPAVEQAPAADGRGTEPAPDGVDRLVQGLPLLALPAVEQLALHSHPPGEPGRADAQEPQGQQVAADAAVEEGQFQLREQLAGKTVVGVLSGGNLDLPELARTLAGAYGLYAGAALLSLLFVWIAVHETKGKTLEQMQE